MHPPQFESLGLCPGPNLEEFPKIGWAKRKLKVVLESSKIKVVLMTAASVCGIIILYCGDCVAEGERESTSRVCWDVEISSRSEDPEWRKTGLNDCCNLRMLLRMLLILLGCSSLETNSDLLKCSFTVLWLETDLISLLILLFSWGNLFKQCQRLRRFTSDRNEIWRNCSSSKYASIDKGSDFRFNVTLSRWRSWRYFAQKSAVLPSGEDTCSICPAHMQQHPTVPDP